MKKIEQKKKKKRVNSQTQIDVLEKRDEKEPNHTPCTIWSTQERRKSLHKTVIL